jgi:hypothetical protein
MTDVDQMAENRIITGCLKSSACTSRAGVGHGDNRLQPESVVALQIVAGNYLSIWQCFQLLGLVMHDVMIIE